MADPGKDKEVYNLFADKIGGAPNVRLKDNLIQGAIFAAITAYGRLLCPGNPRDMLPCGQGKSLGAPIYSDWCRGKPRRLVPGG